MSKTRPYGSNRCINCGEYGRHFIGPSLGEPGFFMCKKKEKSMEIIDRKYKILAVNPCTGSTHDECDSVLFNARDMFLPRTIAYYHKSCTEGGADKNHILSVEELCKRVEKFQRECGFKMPDTNTECEIDRCIRGKF